MKKRKWVYKVTEADIKAGVRGSVCYCIHATALVFAFPDGLVPSVTVQDIRLTIDGERLGWPTPPDVKEYVLAFEAGDFSRIKPMKVVLGEPFVLRKHERGTARLRVKDDVKPRFHKEPTRTRTFGGQRATRSQTAQV